MIDKARVVSVSMVSSLNTKPRARIRMTFSYSRGSRVGVDVSFDPTLV